MNTYSIMGYSLNFPKSFSYDNNNLPYVKVNPELNNGKTICYLKPLQSRLIDSQFQNIENIKFNSKDEVLSWAKNNMKLCNYFSINKIKDTELHFDFMFLPMVIGAEYNMEIK